VEAEGDDLLILRTQGEVSAEQARLLVQLDRDQARRLGYSLILIDGRGLTGFGAQARHATFAEMKLHDGYLGSTAVFGLSGAMRVVLLLLIRAMALLARNFDDEMQVFATEAEARDFLTLRRPQRRAEAQSRIMQPGRPVP
jgi:hypothetical protein